MKSSPDIIYNASRDKIMVDDVAENMAAAKDLRGFLSSIEASTISLNAKIRVTSFKTRKDHDRAQAQMEQAHAGVLDSMRTLVEQTVSTIQPDKAPVRVEAAVPLSTHRFEMAVQLLPSPKARKTLMKLVADQAAHIRELEGAGRSKSARWIWWSTWFLISYAAFAHTVTNLVRAVRGRSAR